jgi:hypothetical protein
MDLEIMGNPPLQANARRRITPSAGTEKDGASTEQYTCDKEYYWQCKHHQTFAFPEENFDDGRPPYDAHCKKLNGNIWMGVSVDLMKVFELPQSLSPEANKKSGGRIKDENAAKLKRKNAQNLDDTAYQRSKKVLKEKVFDFSPEPFSLSDLFSLSFDLNVVFSVDNLKKMAGDMKTMIVPALAFGMWMLLWTIEFSIMCTGSVSFGILLGSFSGGLFNDWYIKLGCLLVYFRKGSKAIAFYITYSKGDLANDMQTVFPIKSNLPGVKEEAQKLHKNFLKDDMDDAMGGADFQVDEFLKVGMLPSGMQKQFYGILHGCDGSFPRISCETGGAGLSAKNIGFGFKTVILLGGDNGFSVYVEKPLEDPKDKKSDSFLFCVGALGEEFCINLGFLLFLLNCLAALADVVLALANWIGGALARLGQFFKNVVKGLADAFGACHPGKDNWMRRRYYCRHHYRGDYRDIPSGGDWDLMENKYCWGPYGWNGCGAGRTGDGIYGVVPFPGCRLWFSHPMCLHGLLPIGGDCSGDNPCSSGFCDRTQDGTNLSEGTNASETSWSGRQCAEKKPDGSPCHQDKYYGQHSICLEDSFCWPTHIDSKTFKCCNKLHVKGWPERCGNLALGDDCDLDDQCRSANLVGWCKDNK